MIPNFCIRNILHKNIAIIFLWNWICFWYRGAKTVTVITIFISCQKFESTGRNYYTLYLMSDVAVNYVFMISWWRTPLLKQTFHVNHILDKHFMWNVSNSKHLLISLSFLHSETDIRVFSPLQVILSACHYQKKYSFDTLWL